MKRSLFDAQVRPDRRAIRSIVRESSGVVVRPKVYIYWRASTAPTRELAATKSLFDRLIRDGTARQAASGVDPALLKALVVVAAADA